MATPAPSVSTFLLSYPEFAKAPSGLVALKLAEAARRTNSAVYGLEQAQDALMLRAAVLLSTSPNARALKLVSDEQAMMWEVQLYEMQRTAAMGLRVF